MAGAGLEFVLDEETILGEHIFPNGTSAAEIAKRIPEIARGVGKGIKEFRSATTEIKQELTIDPPPYNRVQPPTQGTAAPRADSPAQQAATPPPAASSSSAESSEA